MTRDGQDWILPDPRLAITITHPTASRVFGVEQGPEKAVVGARREARHHDAVHAKGQHGQDQRQAHAALNGLKA